MNLSSDIIHLVRDSFAATTHSHDFGQRFYANLFAQAPTLRHLFPADLSSQGHRLVQVVGVAVAKLERLDELAPVLQQLGRRHVDYGVSDEHYTIVGSAFLQTLADILGPAFTREHRVAWALVYGVLAQTMASAAQLEAAA